MGVIAVEEYAAASMLRLNAKSRSNDQHQTTVFLPCFLLIWLKLF